MKTFNFWTNFVDFGLWVAESEDQAKDNFASDAGYKNWADMIDRTKEFEENTIQIEEVST